MMRAWNAIHAIVFLSRWFSDEQRSPHQQIVHPLPRRHYPLSSEQVKKYHRDTPEWTILDEDRRIERTFKFKNFAEAFAFARDKQAYGLVWLYGFPTAVPLPPTTSTAQSQSAATR